MSTQWTPKSAKPVAYLQSREKWVKRNPWARTDPQFARDLFVAAFLRRTFIGRFSSDWRTIFDSPSDAEAFLQDLRSCAVLCGEAVGHFVGDDESVVKTINGLIADAIEREPIADDEAEHFFANV